MPPANARPIHRPLSPFWIYRINWTMGLSGTHRITGLLLSIGAPLFVLWLFAIASGPRAFEAFRDALLSPFGLVVYSGFVFCIVYHLCNGLRHLGWDMGLGFDVPTAKLTGGLVVLSASALTGAVLWLALWRLLA